MNIKITSAGGPEQLASYWADNIPKGTKVCLVSYHVKGASVSNGIPDDPNFFIRVSPGNFVDHTEYSSTGNRGFGIQVTGPYTAVNYVINPPIAFYAAKLLSTHQLRFSVLNDAGQTPTFSEVNLKFQYTSNVQ